MSSWLHCEVELAFLRFLFFGVGFCCVSPVSDVLLLELVVLLESELASLSACSSRQLLSSSSLVFTRGGGGTALFPSSGSVFIVFCCSRYACKGRKRGKR